MDSTEAAIEPCRARRVAALAAAQHGIVTRSQLADLDVPASTISDWARRGWLHRVHRATFAVGHAALDERGRWHAAVLAASPDGALSHRSAAVAWGILGFAGMRSDVTTRRRLSLGPSVRLHRTRTLDEGIDVTSVAGMRVTTVARTIVDLAEVLEAERLARVLHEAAYRGVLDLQAVRDVHARVGATRAGAVVLDAALALHVGGSAGLRSALEARFLGLVSRWGLPIALLNTRVRFGTHRYELDFWWPRQRVCVEVDGPGHRRARNRRADAERDAVLRDAGVTVIRVGPDDLAGDAQALRRRLTTALRLREVGRIVTEV